MAQPKRKETAPPEPANSPTGSVPQFRVVPPGEPADTKPKPARRGVQIGAALSAPAKKGSDKPRIAEPSAELLEVLTQFKELKPQLTQIEGTVKSLSQRAGLLAKPDWFRHWHGRADAGSTMIAAVQDTDVRLIFKESYSKLGDADAVLDALDDLGVGEHFTVKTDLKIEVDKIPADQQQAFVDAVLAKAAELGIAVGAECAITAKRYAAPAPGVHAKRHLLFSPEQNMAIDKIIPITAYPQL